MSQMPEDPFTADEIAVIVADECLGTYFRADPGTRAQQWNPNAPAPPMTLDMINEVLRRLWRPGWQL